MYNCMKTIIELIEFLNVLEINSIYYRLNKTRDESIMVEVTVPGQRWEIEIMNDGTIEIEKFISNGDFYDAIELDVLIKEFSD